MHIPIFAFDFSIAKPAMATLINNKLSFYIWPMDIDIYTEDAMIASGVNVTNRRLSPISKKTYDEHSLIYTHVSRAKDLANIIYSTIYKELTDNFADNEVSEIIIANEGFAYGASGNAILDLSGYKYVLMSRLMELEQELNIKIKFCTYAPRSLKMTAGCGKKGSKKIDMIYALGKEDNDLHLFIHTVECHSEILKKKTAFVDCVDDLADSYWCLKTCVQKENIDCVLYNEQC